MGFLDKWFGGISKSAVTGPNIVFGRYSDSYKLTNQTDAWQKSQSTFENEEYSASFNAFLEYISDSSLQNVEWTHHENSFTFSFYQGSRKISGSFDGTHLRVEAPIAQAHTLHITFLRRLVERNFLLKYSCFALDEQNHILLVFHSPATDASPYKLYYGFKEVALNADKLDDLLLDEFDVLAEASEGKQSDIPSGEKSVKRDFVRNSIVQTVEEIESGSLDSQKFSGGISYLLLNTCYKIDYLVRPEGFVMEVFERCHRNYFSNPQKKDVPTLNQEIITDLKLILQRTDIQMDKELYQVVSTFGQTSPTTLDQINSFIDGEIKNFPWYFENSYHKIANAIIGYIIGYLLFNYALPKPLRDLLHLYYQITEANYFRALGFQIPFWENNELQSKEIKRAIKHIVAAYEKEFPKLDANLQILNFESLTPFLHSYLTMIRQMNFYKLN